jgi:hypothetical protein
MILVWRVLLPWASLSSATSCHQLPDKMLASGNNATFTQRELEIVIDRVERGKGGDKGDKFTHQKVFTLMSDWKMWI